MPTSRRRNASSLSKHKTLKETSMHILPAILNARNALKRSFARATSSKALLHYWYCRAYALTTVCTSTRQRTKKAASQAPHVAQDEGVCLSTFTRIHTHMFFYRKGLQPYRYRTLWCLCGDLSWRHSRPTRLYGRASFSFDW